MARPTIGAGVARRLLDLAVSKGADRSDLLRRGGILSSDLENQDARIDFAKYAMLMRAGKELCGDPALALHFGEAADLSEISVVGLIGAASTSMVDGLDQLNRYSRLVVDVEAAHNGRFQIVRDDKGEWLVDTRLNPNDFPELTESTFARMASSAQRRTGATFALAVHLTHTDPGYAGEYHRIFNTPVVFESDRNGLLLKAGWLDQKIPQQPRYVFGVLSDRADALLNELERAKTMRGRVENLLLPVLHKGDVKIDAIAGELGMSRWTLARRLKDESATYEKILDDLRRKMALHYLNGKKVSVNEAAYLVGFSEASAFSRAYKRWMGESPRNARLSARNRTSP